MGYGLALEKSWDVLLKSNPSSPNNLLVKFLGQDFSVNLEQKSVIEVATREPAKDFLSILILHYLAQKIKGLPELTGCWKTFRDLSGVQGYYEAYHKRALEPIINKYGKDLEAFKGILERLPGKFSTGGDIGLELEVFQNVPVLIKLWQQDTEFAADANLYFDTSIKEIFCTEDIVVLAQILALRL